MITFIPFSKSVALCLQEVIYMKDTTHMNVLSIGNDLVISCGNTEFSKMYIARGLYFQAGLVINYRLPLEVIRLLSKSVELGFGAQTDDTCIIVEEVIVTEGKEPQLLITLGNFNIQKRIDMMSEDTSEPVEYIKAHGAVGYRHKFTVPTSMDYDIETKARWYAALRSNKVNKYSLQGNLGFKHIVDVSNVFKTGIYIKDGLAYADSSKIGVEVYRELDYDGEPMLIGHKCVVMLNDFIKSSANGTLRFFRSMEYMLAVNQDGVVLAWKNLKFTMEPNIQDIRKAKPIHVFECDLKSFTAIFTGISVTKASQIFCTADFGKGELVVNDAQRGVYRFMLDADSLLPDDPLETEMTLGLNFRMIKNLLSIKTGYNKIRFVIYEHFLRIDFINYFEEEDGDSWYDGDNKLVTVVGKM